MKNAEVGKMLWCMNSFQLIVPLVRWAKKIGKAKKSPQQIICISISKVRRGMSVVCFMVLL